MRVDKILSLFTLSIFLCLAFPFWLQDGMFLDGLVYSTIGRNLAHDIGTYWTPYYTATIKPEFFEHPPLVFWLLSILYKIFGDSIFVERLFNALITILIVFGIHLNWQLHLPSKYKNKLSWLPILLWTITPIVFWSFRATILDNLVCAMSLLAVYFISKASQDRSLKYVILASLFIIIALLSKGLVSLFPLATPAIYYLIFRPKLRKQIIYQLVIVAIPVFFIMLLYFAIPEAKNNFTKYIQLQLIPAVNNQREVTSSSHFSIIIKLLSELIVPLALTCVILLAAGVRKIVEPRYKPAFYFILLGLSASLPLMITLKQHRFYLLPSLPFFILGISFIFLPTISTSISKYQLKFLRFFSLALLTVTMIYSVYNFGKPSRDHALISDVEKMTSLLSWGTTISSSHEVAQYYELDAYLARKNNISVDSYNKHTYHLVSKDEHFVDVNYSKVDVALNSYVLYKRIN